jgi:hypothetical protein
MCLYISALFTDPEDRRRWVRHGISLLRASGLHYNPGDAQLYRELAWLFQHKLGGDMDSAHLYYKLSWAREMEYLFGRPHPDFSLLAPETITEMADRYRLKPGPALQVDRLFGPFDWRLPQAHAIYWAWQGRPARTI